MFCCKLVSFHLLILVRFFCMSCEISTSEIPGHKLYEKTIGNPVTDVMIPFDEEVHEGRDDVAMKKNESVLPDFENLTLEEAYEAAVNTYMDGHWDECIVSFTHIIRRYKEHKNAVINCRRNCQKEVADLHPIFLEDIENLHFYVKKFRESLCLSNCSQNHGDARGIRRISREVEKLLADFEPYEYLHTCYYEKNKLQEAANAVFTYLTLHPRNKMASKKFRYYLTLPEVNANEIKNLEIAEFIEFYEKGFHAYGKENYNETVENFEHSLTLYLKAEEDCRLYCENSADQDQHLGLTASIANHFTHCLKCKRRCSKMLNNFDRNHQEDLLPSHYQYLQLAYYKLGMMTHTCQATKSYLLFVPTDPTMLDREKFLHSKLQEVNQEDEYFTPRPEAVFYVKRQEYELRISKFISDQFAATNSSLEKTENTGNIEKLTKKSPFAQLHSTEIDNIFDWRESQPKFQGITVVSEADDLGGTQRYLAEDLLDEMECEALLQLAEKAAIIGDGYNGNESPLSPLEKFEGLTLGRTALMAYFGLLESTYLRLYLQVSELARRHVEQHFALEQPLYFSYTHLVCRSTLPGLSSNGTVFSHSIHADNCGLLENGACLHEPPAFTWRHYTALVYLNDDFDGGEFVFSADPRAEIVQSTIKPRCGRMVAFSADEKNLHGVRGVRSGKRCAVALWFTLDKNYEERERRLAEIISDRVSLIGPVNKSGNIDSSLDYNDPLSTAFRDDPILKLLSQIF